MARIIITMEVDDESADPSDPTGLTEEAYLEVSNALSAYGDDVEIKAEA